MAGIHKRFLNFQFDGNILYINIQICVSNSIKIFKKIN